MRRKHKILLRNIFIWIFVFVVGSLILTFLLSRSTINFVKDKVSNIKDNIQPQKENVSYERIEINSDWMKCSIIELGASANQMSERETKEKLCVNICGNENMEYGKFECEIDKLICYCII